MVQCSYNVNEVTTRGQILELEIASNFQLFFLDIFVFILLQDFFLFELIKVEGNFDRLVHLFEDYLRDAGNVVSPLDFLEVDRILLVGLLVGLEVRHAIVHPFVGKDDEAALPACKHTALFQNKSVELVGVRHLD